MPPPAPIRLLAPNEETGDLFNRLVSDLFWALGYDQPRLNVQKAGREIDVQAKHRTEPRWAMAECKATARPIGGDDVNKFCGTLEAERRSLLSKGEEVAGYFLSLAGFTKTALVQEEEIGNPPRVTLLDGRRIVQELVHGRIVVAPERALERAGRCAARAGADLLPEERPQLLAHELGWIWAVRFRRHGEPTHLALVHADGEALSPALAREVLAADRKAKGDLHRLTYLAPETADEASPERLDEARQAYFAFLAAECGEIELEGLPADQDVGARRLRLESLFVPLHLEPIKPEADAGDRSGSALQPGERRTRLLVGEALAQRARLAILASPGGGKTTLLKRLAVAYAFPERRADLGDRLPDREWFPVLLRCRQIEERATEPIIALLARLGERAEMGELAEVFRFMLLKALREGRVLLLVDGLDEIADGGKRVAFVTQLRTFLSTYPGVDVVVTSREAGFRGVAGSLSAHCGHYRIADFDREDVERLTVAWHREVVGDRPEVERQSRALAATIWESDRVRRLAVNPLLLTTLLLVKRWVRQLPSRRSVLYEKAIEVLLWTWNVQGFEPLDIQEVVPQLAFLAWQMMADGVQRVSQPRLREVLQAARRQMPEVLAYARLSVSEFVERVERRSGLLVLSGHEVEDGRLVPLYEFRHLTFQEYLAAKALAEGNYSDRKEEDTLVSKLEPHLAEEAWREVISLAAVLAGRKAIPLVELLVERTSREVGWVASTDPVFILLIHSLLDEVQIPPELAERALEAICRSCTDLVLLHRLAQSRYGDSLLEIARRMFLESSSYLIPPSVCLWVAEHQRRGWPLHPEPNAGFFQQVEAWLQRGSEQDRAVALLGLVFLARDRIQDPDVGNLPYITHVVQSVIRSEARWEQFAGVWALGRIAPMGEGVLFDPSSLRRLLDLWLTAGTEEMKFICSWALARVPIVPRSDLPLRDLPEEQVRKIRSTLSACPSPIGVRYWRDSADAFPALVAAFYGQLYSDDELAAIASKIDAHQKKNLRKILEQLGEPGQAALREIDKRGWVFASYYSLATDVAVIR